MLSYLWIVPTLPLAGFLSLAFLGGRLPRGAVSLIGVGSMVASAAAAVAIAAEFLNVPSAGDAYTQALWTLLDTGGLHVAVALRLDALSLLMMLVVTVIGSLIHIYSTAYMRDDAGYARFFAYMNLFVAAMLLLVLADDLFVLFFGWEGVGLCSYLLIGFWYEDPKNARAAVKAFLVTRIGDAFMLVGLLLLVSHFGTLRIAEILQRAPETWAAGSAVATFAALMLLGGALGKSGQLPLQVWLPDAMAGPTPVSALIHAATMVTAGVYLIARMHTLFELAPAAQTAVAVLGAATLLLGGACALAQSDIKRVLAYSTISQIGYMFLALGVGAWSAGMFHFLTHAVFKALLFLAAGAIIVALHHEQDMFKMGGLRTRLPLVFWTFLVGAMSLSAMPLVSAGFYSKDMILYEVWASKRGGAGYWLVGLTGAFITSLYTYRALFITFFGEARSHVESRVAPAMAIPLVVLAAAASMVGFIEMPRSLGDVTVFSRFIERALPAAPLNAVSVSSEVFLQVTSAGAVLLGFAIAYGLWFRPRPAHAAEYSGALGRLLTAGWGFDWLYEHAVVLPFAISAEGNAGDAVDTMVRGLVRVFEGAARQMRRAQNGRLRWYAAAMAIGAILAVYLVVYA